MCDRQAIICRCSGVNSRRGVRRGCLVSFAVTNFQTVWTSRFLRRARTKARRLRRFSDVRSIRDQKATK